MTNGFRRAVWFLLVSTLLGGPVLIAQEEKSLAELARLEKARRDALVQESRVITNADLAKMTRARIITSSTVKLSLSTGEGNAGEGEGSGAPDQATEAGPNWEALFAEARANLQTAVNQVLVLELRVNNLRNSYLNEADGATRAMYEEQLAQAREEISAASQREETARAALASLASEATAAGVPPGDVRRLVGENPSSFAANP